MIPISSDKWFAFASSAFSLLYWSALLPHTAAVDALTCGLSVQQGRQLAQQADDAADQPGSDQHHRQGLLREHPLRQVQPTALRAAGEAQPSDVQRQCECCRSAVQRVELRAPSERYIVESGLVGFAGWVYWHCWSFFPRRSVKGNICAPVRGMMIVTD